MSSGFFQMGISKESAKLTAFNTCFGTFKFTRLPMGLKTAPNSFQLLMDKVLKSLTLKSVLRYMDVVVIVSHSFEQYLQDIHEVLGRLESSDLKLNPRKCTFAANKTVFFRHEISRDGICPHSDRVDSIKSFPIPSTAKELRCTLPTWFRKYKPNFSITAFPHPASLLKNVKFVWILINSSMLSFPKFDLPFCFAVDASSRRIGYMLHQLYDNDDAPLVIRFG